VRSTPRWRSVTGSPSAAWPNRSGSTGDAYDNAAVEAFWATLKRELAWIHQRTTWNTRAELRTALFDYIEAFYNPQRIQQRLGHHSPTTYETITAIA
jgi:putative transposase